MKTQKNYSQKDSVHFLKNYVYRNMVKKKD